MRIIHGRSTPVTGDISRLDFINTRVIRVAQLLGYTYLRSNELSARFDRYSHLVRGISVERR